MGQLSGIFISYRHRRCPGYAGRLRQSRASLTDIEVFRDVDSLNPGEDFGARIEVILLCRAMLVVIGPDFFGPHGQNQSSRLFDPQDYVHKEVSLALRNGITTIPVLVQDAPMPKREELPKDMQSLMDFHAVALGDSTWRHDMARLAEVVREKVLPAVKSRKSP